MRSSRKRLIGGVLLLAGLGLTSQAVAHAATHQGAAAKKVTMVEKGSQFAFAPTKVTVTKGTKVTWKNMTNAPHTVTATSSNWKESSANLDLGQSVSFTFKKAGTYTYKCAIHPYMKATVVVK